MDANQRMIAVQLVFGVAHLCFVVIYTGPGCGSSHTFD